MENVLLVSGPSGSGKSTFLTQLQQRELQADILGLLPAEAPDWPLVEANDLIKQQHRPNRTSQTIENLNAPAIIAHYDTHFLRHYDIEAYASDPAAKIWTTAKHLYIVDILTDRRGLRKQFEDRSKQQHARKSLASKIWKFAVRRPVTALKAQFQNKPTIATRNLYKDPTSFDELEKKWRDYVDALVAQENCMRFIQLTPANDTSNSFTVLNDGKR